MTIEEQIGSIVGICNGLREDAVKADKGNAAAGKRVRAGIVKIPPILKAIKKQTLGKE